MNLILSVLYALGSIFRLVCWVFCRALYPFEHMISSQKSKHQADGLAQAGEHHLLLFSYLVTWIHGLASHLLVKCTVHEFGENSTHLKLEKAAPMMVLAIYNWTPLFCSRFLYLVH